MAAAADVDAEIEGEGKPKGGKKKLIIIGAAAALLLAGGGGAAFFLMKGKGGEGAGHEAHGAPAEAAKPKVAVFVDLPEMIVNLSTPSERPQYLRLKIALEVSEERLAQQVQPMIPRVLDTFQIHLREMRPADLDGSAGLYRLKEELLRRINQAVYPAKVEAVLFKEILLQ